MSEALLDPADSLERRNDKLLTVVTALMDRVERAGDARGDAYAQFQRAVLLEAEVKERTRDLERSLDLLHESNAQLAEAHAATEHARRELSEAIEVLHEGFGLFDARGRLVQFNSRFALGMRDVRSVLRQGMEFEDYVAAVAASSNLSLPAGQSREEWREERMRAHEARHAVFNQALSGDRWVQVSEHRTSGGRTAVIQTDITAAIRSEREERGKLLDEQARLVRATLDHLDHGVAIFGADRRLAGWNRPLLELLSLPRGTLRTGAGIDALYATLGEEVTFLGGVDLAGVRDWVARTGRPPLRFEVLARGRVLGAFAEEMPGGGFVMSLRDMTAERRAARSLAKANESLERRVHARTLELEDALAVAERESGAKSRFVAAASHDLMQPLSAAKLYLGSLEDSLDGGDAGIARKARGALASVEEIIGALAEIGRLDSGKVAPRPAEIDLNALLLRLRDEAAPQAALKGLELRVLPASARVRADPIYLRRVLQNLVQNAVRYTEAGRVVIGARRRRDALRIEVWDTGPGIPEELQDEVFKEFTRLGGDVSAAEGMGLGLAIVERACALMELPLEIVSTPGRGTGFLVTVPRA